MAQLRRTISKIRLVPCNTCKATGTYRIGCHEVACPDCHGTGLVETSLTTLLKERQKTETRR